MNPTGTGAHIPSYPSVYNLGHKAIVGIFDNDVVVEEKVDGSQFSFGLIGGELSMRSKGVDIHPGADHGMFSQAVETATNLADTLTPDWVYRCEYLQKPKHNVLAYDRTPAAHLVIFDIELEGQRFLPHGAKSLEAHRLGLEVVPLLHDGPVTSVDELMAFLERPSFLGGALIEGFVVKNYELFTADKKVAVGKFVSEKFKEVHRGDWKTRNPGKGDVVDRLIHEYRTPARWQKAVQHLNERGELLNAPQDIGPLMREVGVDVLKEERDAIADALFAWAWPQIQRGITGGLPDWYKTELAGTAFETSE